LKVRVGLVVAILDDVLAGAVIAIALILALKWRGTATYWLIAGVLAVVAVIAYLLYRAVARAYSKAPAVGSEALVGKVGVALTDVAREGQVMIEGEIWRARSLSGERIARGSRVRVAGVEGLTLLVEKLDEAT